MLDGAFDPGEGDRDAPVVERAVCLQTRHGFVDVIVIELSPLEARAELCFGQLPRG